MLIQEHMYNVNAIQGTTFYQLVPTSLVSILSKRTETWPPTKTTGYVFRELGPEGHYWKDGKTTAKEPGTLKGSIRNEVELYTYNNIQYI